MTREADSGKDGFQAGAQVPTGELDAVHQPADTLPISLERPAWRQRYLKSLCVAMMVYCSATPADSVPAISAHDSTPSTNEVDHPPSSSTSTTTLPLPLPCQTAPVPPAYEEARAETVDFWKTQGYDLSGVEMVFVSEIPPEGCLYGPLAAKIYGPVYIASTDTIVASDLTQFQDETEHVISHEYGHSIQQRTPFGDSGYIEAELEADCFAGMDTAATDTPEELEYAEKLAREMGFGNAFFPLVSGKQRATAVRHGAQAAHQGRGIESCDIEELIPLVGPLITITPARHKSPHFV